VTFMTGFDISGRESAALVAQQKGWFAEENIEVRIEPGGGLGNNLQTLGQQVDFTLLDSAGAFAAWMNGERHFQFIAAIHGLWPMSLLAFEDSGITRPRDLNGRTIGIQPGAIGERLWPAYAEQTPGLDPATVTIEPVAAPNLVTQLVAGQVDAIALFTMGAPAVQRAGDGRPVTVLPWSDSLPDLYGYMLATTTDLIESDPDLVRRFTRAYLRGLAHILEHPAEAGEILHEHHPELSPDIADEMAIMSTYVHGGLRAGQPLGYINLDRVVAAMGLLSAIGEIEGDHNEALPAVDGDGSDGVINFQFVPGHEDEDADR
jgi:NitT/TauT family transport system substrate-binding protein